MISSHDGPQSPGAGVALQGALGDQLQRAGGEFQLAAFHAEELLVLFHQRVLRLGENVDQRLHIQRLERGDHRKPADEFGNHAEFDQILGLNLGEDLSAIVRRFRRRRFRYRIRSAACRDACG